MNTCMGSYQIDKDGIDRSSNGSVRKGSSIEQVMSQAINYVLKNTDLDDERKTAVHTYSRNDGKVACFITDRENKDVHEAYMHLRNYTKTDDQDYQYSGSISE